MSVFTDREIAYLRSQPLGRLATVGSPGRPSVRPGGVRYDPAADGLAIGGVAGSGMAESKKFRDITHRPAAAFVVDDLAGVDPWAPRGIEIRGHAAAFHEGGAEVGGRLAAPFPFDAVGSCSTPDELSARTVA
ncbi:pyridoxamine 5'-phosphate oxidase family protein [Actinoalloteichus hoggarensis]|uniref:Pyridoxamine 5'-phosphate oxidase n=1 Tax=Actinoalloteichus hoggarensis TaxID=1470176 RepID=A0A221W431_9PSEU|nr:PPOX class F420-dependent oxidoreductase [Actinoalloteichus hoggarensis]ASO20391.1 Pyridoxamine 5'-phosphate oxidase [Actinoalloteichus hoggarensis]MBB5923429.1 pyridoxamine 5'-phosphate oxidase family protein [Actinoalloteichus hoggarensis]